MEEGRCAKIFRSGQKSTRNREVAEPGAKTCQREKRIGMIFYKAIIPCFLNQSVAGSGLNLMRICLLTINRSGFSAIKIQFWSQIPG
jgi:hypothetical protein